MGYGVIVLVYRWSVEIGDNRLGLYMVCGCVEIIVLVYIWCVEGGQTVRECVKRVKESEKRVIMC